MIFCTHMVDFCRPGHICHVHMLFCVHLWYTWTDSYLCYEKYKLSNYSYVCCICVTMCIYVCSIQTQSQNTGIGKTVLMLSQKYDFQYIVQNFDKLNSYKPLAI